MSREILSPVQELEHVLHRALGAIVVRDGAVEVVHVGDGAAREQRRQLDEVVVPGLEADVDLVVRVLAS